MLTGIVDHTRDADGEVRARLLDLVETQSCAAYADWLKDRGTEFTSGVKTHPWIRSAATRRRPATHPPEATTVSDVFHVVKLASAKVDDVRGRVQQETLGHGGRTGDPLYAIRCPSYYAQKRRQNGGLIMHQPWEFTPKHGEP